jgi:tricarballylate dehydrogenase
VQISAGFFFKISMKNTFDVIVVGSGNAAMCAGISALENGATVLMVEKADEKEWGGNSRYTAGAMRFAFENSEDIFPLIQNPDDPRLLNTNFGTYPKEKFLADLQHFNQGLEVNDLQRFLVDESLSVMHWLASHNIKFNPSFARQSFLKEGVHTFWGGLALDAEGEGDGLVKVELQQFLALGGQIKYSCPAIEILQENGVVSGLKCLQNGQHLDIACKAVILACGGFESNKALRKQHLGHKWGDAKVRGTRHNMGQGLEMAKKLGAAFNGFFGGCHATPMDKNMPEYGNLEIPHNERKQYRKISYLFGIMLNANGHRFVDEGLDMRNYTYAQFGKEILNQPGNVAWQVFDEKVAPYLYAEYKFRFASFVEADSLEELVQKIDGIDKNAAISTILEYNQAAEISQDITFDPTLKDGKSTQGLALNKTNWANTLDTPPFRAYPVTSGITFTYGGLHVNRQGEVLNENQEPIKGLFACGEMVGGVFFHGYPGGSGLTSGAIFGKNAGFTAANALNNIN